MTKITGVVLIVFLYSGVGCFSQQQHSAEYTPTLICAYV